MHKLSQKSLGLAVRAIIEDSKGQILLIKRSMISRTNPGRWELPGGKVGEGEFFSDALKREVFEETGLIVTPYHAVGIIEQELPDIRVIHLILNVTWTPSEIRLSDEHEMSRWIAKGSIPEMDLADWFGHYLQRESL